MIGTARYVVLTLAPARATWLQRLSGWATDGTLPVELVRCLSPEEMRVHLRSGRTYSAVVVGTAHPGCDRDMAAAARGAGAAVITVTGGRAPDRALVGDVALPDTFAARDLLEALASWAAPVVRVDTPPLPRPLSPTPWRGDVVAVCGPGGTGASTVAAATAQALASTAGDVLLADLCRHAGQAVLHDVRDVVVTIQEVVDAHRSGRLGVDEIRSAAVPVPRRGYALLPGLRRPAQWPALRPRAFSAAFDAIRSSYPLVVCDVEGDVEGEADAGAIEVEERNVMARTAVREASVVFVVGRPGVAGVHALANLLDAVVAAGAASAAVVPVVNHVGRSPRTRAELSRAVADLAPTVPNPAVLLPAADVEAAWLDGRPLPERITGPLLAAHRVVRARAAAHSLSEESVSDDPPRVVPGSLGSWTDEEAG